MTSGDLFPGIRHVTSPVRRRTLTSLQSARIVQFPHPLTEREYRKVAKLLKGHPDITLRAYGPGFTDLEFLRFFPFIMRFQADRLYNVETLDGLRHLRDDLEHLALGEARTARQFSLSFLRRFSRLRHLYLEKHTKAISVIGELEHLEDLTLRSITLPDLSILLPLTNLLSLDLKLGGTKELGLLAGIGRLRYLELWQIRGLEDISVVEELTDLQHLFMQSLRRVEQLPNLRRLTKLRRVTLDTMKGLSDLRPLAGAPALEELLLIAMRHLSLEDLACLIGHPALRAARFGLGSTKRNVAAQELVGLPTVEGPFEFR